jgi:CheY-like chemotaxis protein
MNVDSGKPEMKRSDCSILVVEDDLTNQKVVRLMLGRLDISPCIVSKGREALDLVGKSEFDLILMDLHMPEMDGVETAARLHERLGEDCPPIVALTADVLFGRQMSEEFSGYLLKPVNARTLDQCIHEYVKAG